MEASARVVFVISCVLKRADTDVSILLASVCYLAYRYLCFVAINSIISAFVNIVYTLLSF